MGTSGMINRTALAKHATAIDHLAIAVHDLEPSIEWYSKVLGFAVVERRVTEGTSTGMLSAVLQAGALTIVLLQGTGPESQVTRFVNRYGPGVQHVAVLVEDAAAAVNDLIAAGLEFETPVVGNAGLKQAFSRRDVNSGLMLEIIERTVDGFAEQNVSDLFNALEDNGTF